MGKKADFVAIDMRYVHLQPYYSSVSAVIYSSTGKNVDMVVVDGKIVLEGGKLTTMNQEEIEKEGEKRDHEVVKRAGLSEKVRGRWLIR